MSASVNASHLPRASRAPFLRLHAFAQAISEHPAAAALEGRTHVDQPRAHPLDFSPVNEAGGFFWACNIALRRELFGALAGFDERFPFNAMEDSDLYLRLRQQGVKNIFVPAAAVEHPWRRIHDWQRHSVRHLQSRLIYEELHPGQGLFSVGYLLVVDAKIIMREHLPWLWRRPGVMLRLLPMLWRAMLFELYFTWRRPRPAALNRWLQ